MSALRTWFSQTLPDAFSAWILEGHRRPMVFLLTLVVAPLTVIVLITHIMNVSLWRQQHLRNLKVTARLASEIVNETLAESGRFQQMFAAQPEVQQAVRGRDRAVLVEQLSRMMSLMPRVDLAMVLSPDGQLIASVPDAGVPGGFGPLQGEGAGGLEPHLSGVYLREGPEIEKVVGLSYPIVSGGEVVGTVIFQHQVEEIKHWLQKIRVDPDGFLYVVDHLDQLVVFPFQVMPGKPKVVSDWPPVAYPLTADGASMRFLDQRRERHWFAGISPVGETGWRVVAVQPEHSALRSLYRVLWPLASLVALLALILAFVSMRWAQVQALSLRLLRQNTKILKQTQQRQTLDRMGDKEGPAA